MLVDLRARHADLTGLDASRWLESAGIVTNMNGIPNDPRPPRVTSGIRLGTPALTTRGLREGDMATVAAFIDRVLAAGLAGPGELEKTAKAVAADVAALCAKFPLPA
jgi:glycine hydroxymethyltransferase